MMRQKPIVYGIQIIFRGRFLFLLVSLLLLLLLTPLLGGIVQVRVVLDIFFSFILLSGTNAVSQQKRGVLIAALLALPMLLSTWLSHIVSSTYLQLGGTCFGLLFFGFVIVAILRFILGQHHITFDVIFAAIVVYLLLGVLWSLIYSLLELLHPGSFNLAKGQLQDSRFSLVYYSFVTLTTLGYGDFTPATPIAGSLAVLEAIIGQIYLAVIVATLVGVQIAQSMADKGK